MDPMTLSNDDGCGIILGINFLFFWDFFFLWFQLKMERFQVGVGQSPFRQQKKLRIELWKAVTLKISELRS